MQSHRTIDVRQISREQPPGLIPLLQDAVAGGASVGFLAPLAEDIARAYWSALLPTLGEARAMWVAEDDGTVVGSVQLSLSQRDNGRHRAEVENLMVLSSHRGRGIAKALLQAAEEHAAAGGRTLLVLDTQAGSDAAAVYRRLGWIRAGEIPDFAAAPDGTLRPTVYYFKRLEGERLILPALPGRDSPGVCP